MNVQMQSHLFWGKYSPLGSLTGVVLLVIASSRITFAFICCLALVWVYAFVLVAAKLGGDYFPRWGRNAVLLFISSLAAGIFLLLLWFFDPVLAMECSLIVFFVPVVFIASGGSPQSDAALSVKSGGNTGLWSRVLEYDMGEVVSQALSEALVLGGLILGFSLIREPLGYGSVSFPVLDVIRFVKNEPLRFLEISSGALVILGYGIAVFRYFRNQQTNSEDD